VGPVTALATEVFLGDPALRGRQSGYQLRWADPKRVLKRTGCAAPRRAWRAFIHSRTRYFRIAMILYVSDSVFLPSILTGHRSLALSPLNSAWMSFTIGVRQLRRLM
jgi:hypothetical protein